jgi:TPR repeat protein
MVAGQTSEPTKVQTKAVDPAVFAKAKAGDPAAEYRVGWHYEHPDAIWGEGFTESGSSPHDYAQAAFWYRKAAEQGYAPAQYDLGDLYLFGNGVPVDYEQGILWFGKAAEQGDSAAQFKLGEIYWKGEYAPKNYALAASSYRKAAERGNPDGQAVLAELYEDGRGVPQNYSEAYFWMSLAAANVELAGVYGFLAKEHANDRDRIGSHLTDSELLAVQKRTVAWHATHPTKAKKTN